MHVQLTKYVIAWHFIIPPVPTLWSNSKNGRTIPQRIKLIIMYYLHYEYI